jgi:anti-sigma B factor antagonist
MSLRNRIIERDGAATRAHGGAARFQVDSQPGQGGTCVRPVGEIDMATVGRVGRAIDECVADGCERVVLDLRSVTFMDSSGLHLVVDADAAARAAGWELLLIEGPPPIQRVFEITGLLDRLPFVDAHPSGLPTGTPA